MIKQLLTLVAIGGSAMMKAQNEKVVFKSETSTLPVHINTEKTTATTCNTISVINPSTSVSLYTIPSNTTTSGCSPNAGYVFGTNCYGYTEEATFIPGSTYSTLVSPSITAVSVGFYHGVTSLKGTKGSGTIGMRIYSGTSNTVAPGSAIVTTTTTITNVLAAQTGTSSLFIYTFTITPTAVPATGLFASLVLPTTSAAGDTAVIYTQTVSSSSYSASMPNGSAWEYNGSAWSDVNADWNIKVNHVMFPEICGNSIAALSKNSSLSNNIKIMPNPATGLVNIAVTLGKSSSLSLTLTNALGEQIITTMNYKDISNEIITWDLTNHANGIYFITVSNGIEKMVQRLILNK